MIAPTQAFETQHTRAWRFAARSGNLTGIGGIPVQVRNPDAGRVETKKRLFMSSSLPVAGFAIIEATTSAEAVEAVSNTPCVVAHGVVEVWPLEST